MNGETRLKPSILRSPDQKSNAFLNYYTTAPPVASFVPYPALFEQ